jgi:hypothetical protein
VWKCCGCGAEAPDRESPCDCPTACVYLRREGQDDEIAIKHGREAAFYGLAHDDLARLSRAFNEVANLAVPQDSRINEWLKQRLAG